MTGQPVGPTPQACTSTVRAPTLGTAAAGVAVAAAVVIRWLTGADALTTRRCVGDAAARLLDTTKAFATYEEDP